MANKTLYVKDVDLPLWDRVQNELGENVSSLLTDCLKRRLSAETLELSRTERLMLLNQFRILAKVDQSARHDFEVIETALRYGYTSEYEELFGSSVAGELPRSVAEEVRDTLDLYRMLRVSYRDMALKDLPERDFNFQGFDGNNETDHFAYATYLIEQKGRWTENKGAALNSHSEKAPRYRRMITRWKQCAEKWHPTESEVRAIVAAGTRS